MIFHQPDTTRGRLNSCLKRAQRFAKRGEIDNSHPLYTQYSNFIWYANGQQEYDEPHECKRLPFSERIKKKNDFETDELVQTMIGLDWFALKVDEYAKNNMLDGDNTLAAMLYEWQKRMPFGLPKKKNDARTNSTC